MAKILVVEDELDLRKKLKDCLRQEKFVVEVAECGEEALGLLEAYRYDVLVLDWMLPGISGIELLRHYRRGGGTSPVLMLTGRASNDDRAKGLDDGADDYLTKPFAPKEFIARVKALLRRPVDYAGNSLKAADLELDLQAGRLFKQGKEIELLPMEMALLEFFMRHPNSLFSQDAILERVWNAEANVSREVVRTYVKTLRRKIDRPGEESIIRTVYGLGYRFEPGA